MAHKARHRYRITFPRLYGPGTLGFKKTSARDGHYVMPEFDDPTADDPLDPHLAFADILAAVSNLCDTTTVVDVEDLSKGDGVIRRFFYCEGSMHEMSADGLEGADL